MERKKDIQRVSFRTTERQCKNVRKFIRKNERTGAKYVSPVGPC